MARKLVRRAYAQKTNSEEDALALAAKVARRFPQPPSVERVVLIGNTSGWHACLDALKGLLDGCPPERSSQDRAAEPREGSLRGG